MKQDTVKTPLSIDCVSSRDMIHIHHIVPTSFSVLVRWTINTDA